jgi:hypothetical protein
VARAKITFRTVSGMKVKYIGAEVAYIADRGGLDATKRTKCLATRRARWRKRVRRRQTCRPLQDVWLWMERDERTAGTQWPQRIEGLPVAPIAMG